MNLDLLFLSKQPSKTEERHLEQQPFLSVCTEIQEWNISIKLISRECLAWELSEIIPRFISSMSGNVLNMDAGVQKKRCTRMLQMLQNTELYKNS